MKNSIQKPTLAEVANEDFRHLQVLDNLGMDYCCGGKRLFHSACLDHGLDPDAVLAQLRMATDTEASPAADPYSLSLDVLAAHIVQTHHQFVEDQIPEITRLLGKVAQVHGEAHPELIAMRGAFAEVAAELSQHMKKEELILFPYIMRLAKASRGEAAYQAPAFGTVSNPIHMMESEHETAGDGMATLRELSQGYALPEGACASYWQCFHLLKAFETDLHHHVHLENNVLFPGAIALEQQLRTQATTR